MSTQLIGADVKHNKGDRSGRIETIKAFVQFGQRLTKARKIRSIEAVPRSLERFFKIRDFLEKQAKPVVVEVSKRLVQHSQSKLLNENPGEKAIALDLARRVALDTFPTVAGRILGLYDETAPTWHEQRHHVMNERPCDHEENGTRAWRII